MPQIQSGYEGGGKTLKTSTSPAPSEGYDLLRALTYDRKGDYEERRSTRKQETPRKSTGGGGPTGSYRAPARQEQPREDPITRRLRNAQARAEILRLQASEQPPPMRMVTGAGIIPGYMPDVNAMNAYQRSAYLPNSSQFSGGGVTTPEEMAAVARGMRPLQSPIDLQPESPQNLNAFYGR
jgi:hypothetical protein